MSHRALPLVTRVVGSARDAFGVVETLLPGEDDPEPASEVLQVSDSADGDRASVRASAVADLVDAADGPTSRGDVIERGYSPAEYVLTVVAAHDGQLKQRRFSEEYGWSPATVSRLLSELEDRGVIERYRLGREKVVCLPAASVDSA